MSSILYILRIHSLYNLRETKRHQTFYLLTVSYVFQLSLVNRHYFIGYWIHPKTFIISVSGNPSHLSFMRSILQTRCSCLMLLRVPPWDDGESRSHHTAHQRASISDGSYTLVLTPIQLTVVPLVVSRGVARVNYSWLSKESRQLFKNLVWVCHSSPRRSSFQNAYFDTFNVICI